MFFSEEVMGMEENFFFNEKKYLTVTVHFPVHNSKLHGWQTKWSTDPKSFEPVINVQVNRLLLINIKDGSFGSVLLLSHI